MSTEKNEKSFTDEYEEIVNDLEARYSIRNQIEGLNEINAQDKLSNLDFKILEYKEMANKEEYILNELNDKMEQLIGMRYDHYRFSFDKNLTKQEIEKYYLPKDKKIILMKNIIKKQEIRYNWFKVCSQVLDKQQWTIKNFIDSTRI